MERFASRRRFLSVATAGSLASLGDFSFLSNLSQVSAGESQLSPRYVVFQAEIEPLVKLLEETSRDRVLEVVAARIREGLSYRELLTGLFLAAIRNVQPRPGVGFKFHAVLVIHSAHLASLSAPESDRWLPIFWAIDEFKGSQSRDETEGNWTMPAVNEDSLPPAHRVQKAFESAMDKWDEEAADGAAAALARAAGDHQSFELFTRYSIRDFRSIGHKAIYVANGWRTLQTIGWQHSEPILRSLAYALLNHNGEPNPSESDLPPDRPWRRNQELVAKIRPEWQDGKVDSAATVELLATLREASDEDTCKHVVDLLNRGIATQSIYDALFTGAGELLMRQPGIVGLHAVTSTNAMHYLFQTAKEDQTRLLVLLQNAAFLPLFRGEMQRRGEVGKVRIDQLEAPRNASAGDVAEIFRDIGADRMKASGTLLSYLQNGGAPHDLINAARRLIFLKGTDSHDYKFSSAVLEDYFYVSPEWRNRFLASSVFQLKGSGAKDSSLVPRIRAALQA